MDQWRGTSSDSSNGAEDPASSAWASEVPSVERAELSWDTAGDEPSPVDPAPASSSGAWRRYTVIGVGIAAVVALLVGTVVSLSTDDEPVDTDDTSSEAPTPETTLDTLPSLATTTEVPVGNDASETDGTNEESNGEVEEAPPPSDGEPIDVDVVSSTLELPDELAGFTQPFELVMDTPDGLATLSLPSGTLSTVGGRARSQTGIVVAPDATLTPSTIDPTITTRTGEVIEVEDLPPGSSIEAAGWSAPDGVTQFHAVLWDPANQSAGAFSLEVITIGLDGSILSGEPFGGSFFWTASNGDRIVPDAGGTYAIRPDGTAGRISQGIAVGFADDRVALRSCDVAYQCSLSVASLDGETPPTVFAPGPFEIDQYSYVNSLLPSPDSQAIFVPNPFSSEPDEAIVRANGSRLSIDFQGYRPNAPAGTSVQAAWAPDSSGLFRTARSTDGIDRAGIVFVAINGDVIEIPELPRDIGSIGIRLVDAELPADSSDDLSDQ